MRLAPIAVSAIALGAAACGNTASQQNPGAQPPAVVEPARAGSPVAQPATPSATPAQSPAPTSAPIPAPEPAPTSSSAPTPQGFTFPIAGACLPKGGQLMPNAPRSYRKGTHEGIDFYNSDSCTRVVRGTHVMAAKAGRVVRADVSYVDVTKAQVDAYLADPNTEASLNQFRGRQVWIDHGDGVVTRYCHLDGVAPGIAVGMSVTAGQLVGFVGESGTPSSVRNPGHEYHLHFEVRVGESFLGRGLPAGQVRALYLEVFRANRHF